MRFIQLQLNRVEKAARLWGIDTNCPSYVGARRTGAMPVFGLLPCACISFLLVYTSRVQRSIGSR